jgi:23S rRNA (guanosine2251-2'-O)-methyltransferase
LGWFFYILHHGKEHQIFGIRAIIEAIQSGATVDKVYIQKEASSELERLNEGNEAREYKFLICSS